MPEPISLASLATPVTLDRLGLEVAVRLTANESPRYLLVETAKLQNFRIAGYSVNALSEAEAVGAVLMTHLPDTSCAELGLDGPRIIEQAQLRQVPVVTEQGLSAEGESDLESTDPHSAPSYLVVFKDIKPGQLNKTDESEDDDRVYCGARTIYEAVGLVLLQSPSLTYDAVLDHMEV